MSDPYRWLIWAHVCANVVWIGAIIAVAYFAATRIGEVGDRATLASRFYKSVATPAFIVSFIAGGLVLASNLHFYFVVEKWMHGKLFFAFVVIVVHHIIGGRVRRASDGNHELTGGLKKLAGLLAAAAFVTVFFAILRPM